MTTRQSFRRVVFSALLLLGSALPALAQETEESVATTVAPTEDTFRVPAVSIAELPAEDVVAPWTTKFLVPLGVVLGAIAIFATVVQYFRKVVRNRYKVVE